MLSIIGYPDFADAMSFCLQRKIEKSLWKWNVLRLAIFRDERGLTLAKEMKE
jgi:hypothetical protein